MVPLAAALRPPLDLDTALTAHVPDAAGLVLVALLAFGYLAAVRAVVHTGHHWPARRTMSWLLLGVGALAVTTLGWVGAYTHTLLWVHVLQIVLLLLVVPALLALGRPTLLVRTLQEARAGPPRERRAAASRLLAALANPLVAPALVPIALGVVVFTAVLPVTLGAAGWNDVAEVLILGIGLLIALPLAGVGAAAPSAVALATFVGFLELLLDAIPGFALRLRNDLLAPVWAESAHRSWGPTPLQDQRLGGAILWALAEILDLPFLALLVMQWIRADEREAAVTDAALDAATLVAPPKHQLGPDSNPPGTERPWWEQDARVLGSARARSLQKRRD